MKKIIITALMAAVIWTGYRTEIDVGRVLNNQGDGKLYNGESYYNYIKYPDQYKADDIIMTVEVLNPLNTAEDDVIIRHDVRLFKDI